MWEEVKHEAMEEEEDEDAPQQGKDAAQVWLPGMGMNDDEQLDYDSTAYLMFHRLRVEWPCLSFDVIPDNLDPLRYSFPHSMYLAAGTQAARADQNKLLIMKLSEMHKVCGCVVRSSLSCWR